MADGRTWVPLSVVQTQIHFHNIAVDNMITFSKYIKTSSPFEVFGNNKILTNI